MERTTRKQMTGKVVSKKTAKTIIISIDSYKKHPLYGKRFKSTKRFAIHDEKEIAKEGDIVLVHETRPVSKTKRFRLVKVLESVKDGK